MTEIAGIHQAGENLSPLAVCSGKIDHPVGGHGIRQSVDEEGH